MGSKESSIRLANDLILGELIRFLAAARPRGRTNGRINELHKQKSKTFQEGEKKEGHNQGR